jgi:hypothetical protein
VVSAEGGIDTINGGCVVEDHGAHIIVNYLLDKHESEAGVITKNRREDVEDLQRTIGVGLETVLILYILGLCKNVLALS